MPRGARSVALLLPALTLHCGTSFTAAADGGPNDGAPLDGKPAEGAAGEGGEGGSSSRVLATVGDIPLGITLDGDSLYWVTVNDKDGTGSVETMLKGGGAVTTLASGQVAPVDVATDSSFVYWSVNTGVVPSGSLQCLVARVDKGGGSTSCVSAADFIPIRMSIGDGVQVLSANPGKTQTYIGFADKLLGSAYMATPVPPSIAAHAGGGVSYVGDGSHVDDYSIGGAVQTAICQEGCPSGQVVDITLDGLGTTVLWITDQGYVGSAPSKPSMEGKTIGRVAGAPRRIVVAGTHAFVTSVNLASSSGVVSMIALSGTGPMSVLAVLGACAPYGLASDGDSVFFTCSDGTIRAVDIP